MSRIARAFSFGYRIGDLGELRDAGFSNDSIDAIVASPKVQEMLTKMRDMAGDGGIGQNPAMAGIIDQINENPALIGQIEEKLAASPELSDSVVSLVSHVQAINADDDIQTLLENARGNPEFAAVISSESGLDLNTFLDSNGAALDIQTLFDMTPDDIIALEQETGNFLSDTSVVQRLNEFSPEMITSLYTNYQILEGMDSFQAIVQNMNGNEAYVEALSNLTKQDLSQLNAGTGDVRAMLDGMSPEAMQNINEQVASLAGNPSLLETVAAISPDDMIEFNERLQSLSENENIAEIARRAHADPDYATAIQSFSGFDITDHFDAEGQLSLSGDSLQNIDPDSFQGMLQAMRSVDGQSGMMLNMAASMPPQLMATAGSLMGALNGFTSNLTDRLGDFSFDNIFGENGFSMQGLGEMFNNLFGMLQDLIAPIMDSIGGLFGNWGASNNVAAGNYPEAAVAMNEVTGQTPQETTHFDQNGREAAIETPAADIAAVTPERRQLDNTQEHDSLRNGPQMTTG